MLGTLASSPGKWALAAPGSPAKDEPPGRPVGTMSGMAHLPEDRAGNGSLAELRRLVIQLGTAMVAAGDAVDLIEGSLGRLVAAYGAAGVQIALLPTSLFIQTGTSDSAYVQFSSQVAPPLRLDQIDGLYRLVRQLERAEFSVSAGLDQLAGIYRRRPAFGWPLRTVGHAVLTAGLVLLIQPTPGGIFAALVLGLFIGVLKLARLPTAALLLPIMASFLIAAAVLGAGGYLHIDNPIRLLVAPLVTFLPGGMLAIATMEIAAGQMVSGASRLVNGFVQLALLAFGIVAAGWPPRTRSSSAPAGKPMTRHPRTGAGSCSRPAWPPSTRCSWSSPRAWTSRCCPSSSTRPGRSCSSSRAGSKAGVPFPRLS
jgi:uncharacterized membrane protein YjjP (DUF1212 family)